MEQSSLNFEFLREHDELLARIGTLAEASLYSDPSNTLAKSRIFAEKTVDRVYRAFNLPPAFGGTLVDRLNQDSFKSVVPRTVLDKLHTIRIQGNKGAHDVKANTSTAAAILREVFDLARWVYVMFWDGTGNGVGEFTLPPKPADHTEEKNKLDKRLREKIASQEAELQVLIEKLESAQAKIATTEQITVEQLQTLSASGQRASDVLQFSEEQTRKRLIDTMIVAAGWDIDSTEEVKQEVPLSNGEIADYVLYHSGLPVAVIEAKKTSISAESGRTQAEIYAAELERQTGQRPVIFYTNGFETYIWNNSMNETPRRIFGLYSKDSLNYLIFQRENRLNLESLHLDANIANRIYQIEAIKRVTENFERGKRKALIVQATGTGKTRVAVSICELMTRARWAKRILFLCDRRELRKQADDVFKEYLPGEPRTIVSSSTYRDKDKRIYLATYPAIMQCFESFDIGFFDLIIADESHRSIYNRYRDVFLYFDALQIGLTATPIDFINRNTFDLFDCETDDATASFGYEEAINSDPPYLVPFEVFDDTTDFLRRGIKYTQLSADQKTQLEESEDDAQQFDYEPEQLNKLVFNRPTNEFILRNLMENGLREAAGQHIGKSIVFARSHNHAMFLQKVFDEIYPQYGGGFCRVIDSHDPRAAELITEFKKVDSPLTLAISVDMLDTGIDIPEVVNLVFAKPVKSYVKFWQMIGRGTRLREHLFGRGKHKTKFYIFDHCGNFEFFDEHYKAAEPSVQKSLLQRIFEARINLANAAISAQDTETLDLTIDLIRQDIVALPQSSVSIKEKLREILSVQQEGVLERFEPQTVNLLVREIGPLMQWRSIEGHERMYDFDLLTTRLQTALVEDSADFANYRDVLRTTVSRLPITLNEVRDKKELIDKVKNLQFWEKISPNQVEEIRNELRGLMRLLDPSPGPIGGPRETNVDEDESKIQRKKHVPKLEGLQLAAYKRRVHDVLEELVDDSPALQKIKRGEPLATGDFDELCKLVLAQDPELDLRDLQSHFPELADKLDIAIRSIIGLNAEAVQKQFDDFVQRNNLKAKQIRFLSLLKNHLTKYGTVEIARLYEPPFTDIDTNGIEGVFSDEIQIRELIQILETNNLVN